MLTRNLAVRAHRHALRLDPDRHVAKPFALVDVDDRHRVVILIGDIQNLAGGVLDEELGVRPGGKRADDFAGRSVDDLDRVVVADRDKDEFLIFVISMPRGRWPTLMVRTTCHLSVSMTETVLLFSFDT